MFSTAIPKQMNFRALRVAVWRQTGRLAAIWIGVLALASCAVSPIGDETRAAKGPDAQREAVEARVKARWDALIKGDLEASYALLSPASRQTLPFERYKNVTRKSGYRDAKIEAVDCDAASCKVKLRVTYDHRLMKGITTPMEETWVFDKGQAWYVYPG
jgi:hypothetical protein